MNWTANIDPADDGTFSDYVDPETAKKLQTEKLVQIGVGVKMNEGVI